MRRRAAHPASGGHDDDTLDALAGSGRLSDPSETTDTALDVQAALRRLVPEQQAALMLVDMLGYPTAAAAEVLGVPEGTVKSRAARGRARLVPKLAHLRPVRDRGDGGPGQRALGTRGRQHTGAPTAHCDASVMHGGIESACQTGGRSPRRHIFPGQAHGGGGRESNPPTTLRTVHRF
jgi:hypothetical protein